MLYVFKHHLIRFSTRKCGVTFAFSPSFRRTIIQSASITEEGDSGMCRELGLS